MKKYAYCKRWFRAHKRPIDIWNDGVAKTAHENRHPYTVLDGEVNHPSAIIEVADDYFGVGFLDDQLREYLVYQFQEIESNKLFLTMAIHRQYQDESDEVVFGDTYIFEPDGNVKIRNRDLVSETISARQITTDVSGNWESYPEFGEYESLLATERINSSDSS